MDTVVYFVRHGTTANNVSGHFQGVSDVPLGELGLRQAACLGERFASVPLDAVYTSPLTRARQTAEGVCAKLSLEPILCGELHEIDGGLLEGHPFEENVRNYPEVMRRFREEPAKFDPPGGENASEVHARMTTAVRRIVRDNPGKTVAIVSHGFALLCSLGCLMTPFERLRPDIPANASVSRVRFHADGGYEIELYNDCSHLTEDCVYHSPYWERDGE